MTFKSAHEAVFFFFHKYVSEALSPMCRHNKHKLGESVLPVSLYSLPVPPLGLVRQKAAALLVFVL